MEKKPTTHTEEQKVESTIENKAKVLTLENLFDPDYKEGEEVIEEEPVETLEELMNPTDSIPPDEEETEEESEEQEEEEEEQEETVKSNKNTPTDKKPEVSNNNPELKKIVSDLWGTEMSTIVMEDEEGNEVEVPLEDFEMTPESLKAIIASKIAEIDETSKKDKISTASVSEFTKKLIEIEKNGGSIADALEIYETYQDPINSLDLSQESDQIAAISLSLQMAGRPESEILDYIDVYKTKGELEERAVKAKEYLEGEVTKKVDLQAQEALNIKKKQEANFKAYKNDLKDILKSAKMKESVKQKIVSAATKKGDKGYDIDNLYKQYRNDPKQLADLAYFMLDKEGYLKDSNTHLSNENNKKTFLKLKLAGTNRKTGVITKEKTLQKEVNDPLAKLFNEE